MSAVIILEPNGYERYPRLIHMEYAFWNEKMIFTSSSTALVTPGKKRKEKKKIEIFYRLGCIPE